MNLNDLNFNIFNILIISGVLHGIIFSCIVYSQKKKFKKSTLFLGFTVLFLSLSNLQYWLIDVGLTSVYPIFKYIFIPWHWLILPMFYFYVYKLTHTERIKRKTYILLISPFIIVLLIHLIQVVYKVFINIKYSIPSHFKVGIYVYLELFSLLFNILIMFLAFKMITKYENNTAYNTKWIKTETNWLKKLIYTGFAICICWLIAISVIIIYNLDEAYIFYPMWIGISILVYWIGYVGLTKSKQLQERIELRKKRKYNTEKKEESNSKNKAFEKLENEIIKNKAYLNPKLSLELLSKTLNLNESYISQQIKSNSNMSFNDYVNSLRIENAKQILENKDYDNYTIVSVGLESGFNSKSSFYTAFKKFTNKTPVQYKKDVRNL